MVGMQTAAQAYYLADSAEQVALALESCAVAEIADYEDALAATQILRLWAAVVNAGERPGQRVLDALDQITDRLEMYLAQQPA